MVLNSLENMMKKNGVMKDLEKFLKFIHCRSIYGLCFHIKDLIASNGQVQGPGEYYRQNILKKYVINDKNDSDFGGMFQHDQAKAHMAITTRELLEEYNTSVIE